MRMAVPIPCKEFDNSLCFWYPKIKDLVPTPKTTILPLPNCTIYFKWLDEGIPETFIKKLKLASQQIGFPVFMRTDQMACKHDWKDTCYVKTAEDLEGNLSLMLDTNLAIDMAGELLPKAIVIREFLYLKSFFKCTAYKGMPVAREFRFFATKGHVDCYHPYWVHDAIAEGKPSTPKWREDLPELERLEEPEKSKVFGIAQKASTPFREQISVDICQTRWKHWYITDLACGSQSYHWKHGTVDGGERY